MQFGIPLKNFTKIKKNKTISPTGVPDKVLLNARLMQVQLLVSTHTPEVTQLTRDIYDVYLEIHLMKLGDGALLIQMDLKNLFTNYTITTFGCHKPTPDILIQLNWRIENNVDFLYKAVAQHVNKHTVCTTKGESQNKYTTYPVPS